jgi:8-oxo-dGTP diphosphatase
VIDAPADPPGQVPGVIHVVAGILIDASGRLLLAQRPPGKHLAGMWEFPGGKCEPGEPAEAALVRELREELGIEAEPAGRVLLVPWDDGDKRIALDAIRVARWRGDPRPCEGQALRWEHPDRCDPAALAPADRPVLHRLREAGC